ncbi:MAG: NAD(P)-dependent alcohol dehydrogenase [Saprospiraceae bacterium]
MKQTEMKAILFTRYGSPDVLKLAVVEKPVPKEDEVLIKIHATTVTAGDCELRAFKIAPLFWLPVRLMFGIWKPRVKILGQEFAGEVVEVGNAVTNFKKGDPVFGATGIKLGAYAEYKCQLSTRRIALKPSNMRFEEAATIPTGGLNALYFIEKANIQPGEKVLINGAGGSIGTYAVQLAKLQGAEVTAVDSQRKLDMLRSIGADHVIDYTQVDFTQNGQHYDVIIDVAGKCAYTNTVKSLTENGRYIQTNPSLSLMLRGLWTAWTSRKKVLTGFAGEDTKDLETLKDLIEAGKLKAVIDKRYPLDETAEAHRYVEKGFKTGHLVIQVFSSD